MKNVFVLFDFNGYLGRNVQGKIQSIHSSYKKAEAALAAINKALYPQPGTGYFPGAIRECYKLEDARILHDSDLAWRVYYEEGQGEVIIRYNRHTTRGLAQALWYLDEDGVLGFLGWEHPENSSFLPYKYREKKLQGIPRIPCEIIERARKMIPDPED